jgi:hypothetical protein
MYREEDDRGTYRLRPGQRAEWETSSADLEEGALHVPKVGKYKAAVLPTGITCLCMYMCCVCVCVCAEVQPTKLVLFQSTEKSNTAEVFQKTCPARRMVCCLLLRYTFGTAAVDCRSTIRKLGFRSAASLPFQIFCPLQSSENCACADAVQLLCCCCAHTM